MKAIKLLLMLTTIVSLQAQELNEDFLNSLPDDIKKDLQDKNSQQRLNSEENYRPYLYSSKLNRAEELISLKGRLENDLSELNRRLQSDENLNLNEELKLYGSEFFNTFQTSFMPINEPNPDSSYALDIGDVLKIQLIGQQNYIDTFVINADGAINLPSIGKIIIAGLNLIDASSIIKIKVNAAVFGTEAYISLDKIRDVNILVTGDALNPGIYTLTGNSNLLHAISAAGGISEFGSLRKINLIRDNITIESLDVYDLLIEGKYNLKKRLRSGDVIFVEPRKNVVTIDGAINRPAKYEVISGQNLFSIIGYANGLNRTADRENIFLERILDGVSKTIPVRNEIQFQTINAEDGDLIYIRQHPFRQAKISGAVLKPGSYTMAQGETINDLLEKSGGYSNNAYIFGAVYTNEDAKLIDKKSKDILYQQFLDNILAISQQNMGQDFDLTPIIKLTEELKNTEIKGRVVVDLFNDSSIDLYNIKDGDELFIPEKNNVVYVYGESSIEGAVMYVENKGVEYFVDKSGGFNKFADNKAIFILHPNGESQMYSAKRNIFENSPKSDIKIYPGSIIFIPKVLDEATPKRLAVQAYISILGNLGIALASLSAISKD